ncbi:hypothetical protein PGH26_13685 [Sporosarcina jeotgali]|uniref:Uncharacterized protein n=1 Tax=Sporosarcina jeotgali TaxID=3020056 RepID=A0ABZ0KU32_9BACL|nr:hypothetical protein [Sporosarcina sp. B2O-1]WOV83916.1 hypothetical protein PGH26_13685 [Sporosarcina sp. B2O-1]
MRDIKNMRDAAYGLDDAKGGALLSKILVSDIVNEVSQFSEYADNAHPELAQLFMVEVQSKLRIFAKLLQSAEIDMKRDFERLDTVSDYIFEEVVRNETTKKA